MRLNGVDRPVGFCGRRGCDHCLAHGFATELASGGIGTRWSDEGIRLYPGEAEYFSQRPERGPFGVEGLCHEQYCIMI